MIRKVEGTQFDYEVIQGKCPLPRIGSKDWGWKSGIKCGERVWRSSLTKNTIEMHFEREGVDEYNHRGGYVVLRPGHVFLNSVVYGLSNAKRLAELLARRDWRRENRGKK